MTAREAMQALLNGKGVISDQDRLYWLTEQDRLVFRRVHGFVESDSSELNQIVSLYGESSDYPLTFEQALRAMLDGKVVEVELSYTKLTYRFNHELSCFEFYSIIDDKWWMTHIPECEQSCCKWRVVE